MAQIKPKSTHTKRFCLSQQIPSLSVSHHISTSLELEMGLAFLWAYTRAAKTPQPLSGK